MLTPNSIYTPGSKAMQAMQAKQSNAYGLPQRELWTLIASHRQSYGRLCPLWPPTDRVMDAYCLPPTDRVMEAYGLPQTE